MKRVFKYQLEITDLQTIEMPLNAEILSVQEQHEKVCIWALVDDAELKKQLVSIGIVGTGHPCKFKASDHVGSVVARGGALVWHVFVVASVTL